MGDQSEFPDNPFSEVVITGLDPDGKTSLPALVYAAITSTVDDQIFQHIDSLVDELDDRGEDAWRETVLLLIQYVLSSGVYGAGQEAADRFLASQLAGPSASLIGLKMAFYEYLRGDREAAGDRLHALGPDATSGAARYLLVMVLTRIGWPTSRRGELLVRYCSGVDKPVPGQEPHDHSPWPQWDNIPIATGRRIDFMPVTLLVAAGVDRCRECKQAWMDKILEIDRRVLGHLATLALDVDVDQERAAAGGNRADVVQHVRTRLGARYPDAASALLDAAAAGDLDHVEQLGCHLDNPSAASTLNLAIDTLITAETRRRRADGRHNQT